jgi:hypothetical protein
VFADNDNSRYPILTGFWKTKTPAPQLRLPGHIHTALAHVYRGVVCDLRMRRIAFLRSIRFSSLLDTNHRLRRTSESTLLFITSFLKRRSNCSGDSPGRDSTLGNYLTSFLVKSPLQSETGVAVAAKLSPGRWNEPSQKVPLRRLLPPRVIKLQRFRLGISY